MLALAIISTVILGLLILTMFAATVNDYDDFIPVFILTLIFGFVIITIWILYVR